MHEAEFDRLLLSLGDTIASSDWQGWLREVSASFNASVACLTPLRGPLETLRAPVAIGVSANMMADYVTYFHGRNTWLRRMVAADPGVVHSLRDLVPDRELLGSEFYNDYMTTTDSRYAAGVLLDDGRSQVLFDLIRDRSAGDFDGAELRWIARLAMHLDKALRAAKAVHESTAKLDGIVQSIDRFKQALILLDAQRRAVLLNARAERMIADGRLIDIRAGRVVVRNKRHHGALDRVLGGAEADPLDVHAAFLDGAAPATVLAMALSPRAASILDFSLNDPRILLVFRDHAGEEAPDLATLSRVFGLTESEAQTVALLVEGLSVSAIAARLDLSRETVRHHLKRAFWKTGCHSQRELVTLINGGLGTLTG